MNRNRRRALVASGIAIAVILLGAIAVAATVPGGFFGGTATVTAQESVQWVNSDGPTGLAPRFSGCGAALPAGGYGLSSTDAASSGSADIDPASDYVIITVNAAPGETCDFSGYLADTSASGAAITINGLDLNIYTPDGSESGAPSSDESDAPGDEGNLAAHVYWQNGQPTPAPFTITRDTGSNVDFDPNTQVYFQFTIPSYEADGTYDIVGSFDASFSVSPSAAPTPQPPSSPPASSPSPPASASPPASDTPPESPPASSPAPDTPAPTPSPASDTPPDLPPASDTPTTTPSPATLTTAPGTSA